MKSFGFLALALAACSNWPGTGGGGKPSTGPAPAPATDPPVLTDVSMPASASASNGVYTMVGTITYSDTDDVVSTVEIQLPVLGKTYSFPVDNPVSEAVAQVFEFTLSADVPLGGAGPTTYYVILVNKSGAKSAPYQESVDLQ